jgi:hypothetical protein
MTDPELPSELADLFAAERGAPGASPAVRTAVRAKLAAAIAHAPLAGLGIGKLLAILALTIGAGTYVALRHSSGTADASPPTAHTTAPAPQPPPPAPHDVAIVAPDLAPPPAPARRPAPRHVVAEPPAQPLPEATVAPPPPAPAQAVLVRDAWLALSANDPRRALDLADQDASIHPDGVLAEEREAIRIVALARLGHIDEARVAASTFLARYPATVHRDLVTDAIAPETTP